MSTLDLIGPRRPVRASYTAVEHLDVVIVGAGLSGIGMACHLRTKRPGTTFTLLEARDETGGTWSLFRYPGVRSDSDMHTLGYRFRPWARAETMPGGAEILDYVRETAREYRVLDEVRLRHRLVAANWDSERARWELRIDHDGAEVALTCSFLLMCGGYYRNDGGFKPDLPGIAEFGGQVVHPQAWPEDLDYAGKRVVVLGSGATAVTLVPALARDAAHVTMVQRSPSYVLSLPSADTLAPRLARLLPGGLGHRVVRWRNIATAMAFYQLSQRRPELVRRMLRKAAVAALPAGYPVDEHFNPRYGPWDQRMCMVPDGDFFTALGSGRATVATDTIAGFDHGAVRLTSGKVVLADILVTATGFNLGLFGGAELSVDGRPVRTTDTMTYLGMMLAGVPNMVYVLGYTNATWTLKLDLVAGYLDRLLRHMSDHAYDVATPSAPPPGVTEEPFVNLTAGYVQRGLAELPRQGSRLPWRPTMNYVLDTLTLRRTPITREMTFSRAATPDRQPLPPGPRAR
ncbi:flavin-containing monooxygenase [Actinokineospora terrae]|uniref:Predicted flavoprotein CzcO associated with the cation diffusion facilitator CzcD n=1 Tax=Actinokineospora terrae TaxID=155974 RepID=A0A1H9XNX9_9PSEU|nr:NAD(P)/FAD-dependent oxidoreductase [Actinokineospora terrae]SES47866.1 Predicted flavoprotein CzcO associated with the cation diffusion facilitator CzcD [Actinokineospora terrae]